MTVNPPKIILVFTRFYLPGVSAGGPIKSVSNLVNALGDEFIFKIITLNSDINDEEYSSVIPGSCVPVGKASVIYFKNDIFLPFRIIKAIREERCDLIYLNSFFDPLFSILPIFMKRMSLFFMPPLLLAPRGEFSIGALSLKKFKKTIYINFAKALNLYKDIVWHASTSNESSDILRVFSPVLNSISTARVISASDISIFHSIPSKFDLKSNASVNNSLRICFLSRITKMKNILFFLEILRNVKESIELSIYGPIEDAEYWKKCQKAIELMPANIIVNYFGPVASIDVAGTIAKHDLFILPTLGENYGHVIVEAWAAGVPVLISDKTPWKNLKEKNVGWDISIDSPDEFKEAIIEATKWSNEQRNQVKKSCYQEANAIINNHVVISDNRAMLQNAINTN
jgi:glycosyltransferase involved in cell wall biosynthesis